MMDFISVPIITGIVFYSIYCLFELFARRKERMAIIEKLSEKDEASNLARPSLAGISFNFGSLKFGCLLCGFGLGMLVGFIISVLVRANANCIDINDFQANEMIGTAYGASIFLFSGLGLIISFIIENKMHKKREQDNKQ